MYSIAHACTSLAHLQMNSSIVFDFGLHSAGNELRLAKNRPWSRSAIDTGGYAQKLEEVSTAEAGGVLVSALLAQEGRCQNRKSWSQPQTDQTISLGTTSQSVPFAPSCYTHPGPRRSSTTGRPRTSARLGICRQSNQVSGRCHWSLSKVRGRKRGEGGGGSG